MTTDEVRALHSCGWPVYGREAVGVLLAEIDRLKAGRFTEEEFQNLCHGFTPDDRERFEAGCPAALKEGRDHAG